MGSLAARVPGLIRGCTPRPSTHYTRPAKASKVNGLDSWAAVAWRHFISWLSSTDAAGRARHGCLLESLAVPEKLQRAVLFGVLSRCRTELCDREQSC